MNLISDSKSFMSTAPYSDDQQKKISTRAFFPNDTSFESETTSESERGSQQEGYATANLNDRVLHGHLKWRPDIVKDVMVSV